MANFVEKNIQKAKRKYEEARRKAYLDEYGYEPGRFSFGISEEKFVRDTSINDADLQKMIQQLTSTVGTQVSEQQNRRSDLLFDAPLATREAAGRGADIRGNQAIEKGTTSLELAQSESERAARRNFYQLSVDEEKLNMELQIAKEEKEAEMIGNLFGDIGQLIGYES